MKSMFTRYANADGGQITFSIVAKYPSVYIAIPAKTSAHVGEQHIEIAFNALKLKLIKDILNAELEEET